MGARLMLSFVFVTAFLAYRKSNWLGSQVEIWLISYGITWMGAWLKPKQASFRNLHTVADLVRKMDRQNRVIS